MQPVRVDLHDRCQLQITADVPSTVDERLAAVRGTQLYAFLGVGSMRLLTVYLGISSLIDGSRVVQSFRQRVSQMRPAALVVVTRPEPYTDMNFLKHLESAALKRLTMRVRALNTQTSAGLANSRLYRSAPHHAALAEQLAQQIADAITVYGLSNLHNVHAHGYYNNRDWGAALIHRLGGRAVDTRQLVQMLLAAGARLNAAQLGFATRRDMRQREPESGNARVHHVLWHDAVNVFYPAGILTPAAARLDYELQRQRWRGPGPLPVPQPRSKKWCRCRCPYCSPTTSFTQTPSGLWRTAA